MYKMYAHDDNQSQKDILVIYPFDTRMRGIPQNTSPKIVHPLAIWIMNCLRKCVWYLLILYSELKKLWNLIEPEVEKLISLFGLYALIL